MEITIAIALYVLGFVLGYGRQRSTSLGYGMDFSFLCVFSWIWFLAGAMSWVIEERHDGIKFLKF